MSAEKHEILDALVRIDLRQPYLKDSAEVVRTLIIRSYRYHLAGAGPEHLKQFQMDQLACAISHLYRGWLGAAAHFLGSSFSDNVAEDAGTLKRISEAYKEISPHMAGAIESMQETAEIARILEKYANKRQ